VAGIAADVSAVAAIDEDITAALVTQFRWNFDDATSMADPGTGEIRLNDATIASVTAIAVSALSADTGNPDISAYVATWGDSTNTLRGTITLRKLAAPSTFAIFSVTGSVTDNTDWLEIAVTHVASNGSLTAADQLVAQFSLAGDKGADGLGVGDVVGPASAGDNSLPLYDGTTGKLIKAGVALGTSGHVLKSQGAGQPPAFAASNAIEQGLHTIWIPAAAMKPTVSNGCAALTSVETTSGRPDINTLDFDAAADEHAQFDIAFPKSWNRGTITFRVHHTTTATDTDGVAWALQGRAVGDNDTINSTYGTARVVTDAYQSAANMEYVTAIVSIPVTITGAPQHADRCIFRIFRDVSDSADTATEDARLLGVAIFYTVNAATDA